MLLNILTVITLVLAALVLMHALRQKDVLTKILLLNSGTSIAALFMCFLGSYKVNSSYIDIAIIYFLLSVVASCSYLKFFLKKESYNDE